MPLPNLFKLPQWKRLLLVWGALFALGVSAQAESLPPPIQAVLIGKILLFDRSIPKDRPVPFVVVYGDEKAGADELAKALVKSGKPATVVKAADLSIVPGSVVFFFPKAISTAATQAAVESGALTFGADPSSVEKGDVGIAMALRDGKPQILVNLKVVRAQKHDFSSDFLNLATVIR